MTDNVTRFLHEFIFFESNLNSQMYVRHRVRTHKQNVEKIDAIYFFAPLHWMGIRFEMDLRYGCDSGFCMYIPRVLYV